MGSSDGEQDHHQIQINNNNNHKKKMKIDNNLKDSPGLKPKRQMKTPYQLETLERVYSEETYPSEATRLELSEKLDLSDRQLQMWFCHRRLKDKKDGQVKKPVLVVQQPVAVNELPVTGSVSGSGSESRRSSSSRAELDEYEGMGKAGYEPRLSAMVRRAIACIEGQLGEPLRDDGPILGMEFDPLPPGAFGMPIAKHQGHQYEREQHDARPRRVSFLTLKLARGFTGVDFSN